MNREIINIARAEKLKKEETKNGNYLKNEQNVNKHGMRLKSEHIINKHGNNLKNEKTWQTMQQAE